MILIVKFITTVEVNVNCAIISGDYDLIEQYILNIKSKINKKDLTIITDFIDSDEIVADIKSFRKNQLYGENYRLHNIVKERSNRYCKYQKNDLLKNNLMKKKKEEQIESEKETEIESEENKYIRSVNFLGLI